MALKIVYKVCYGIDIQTTFVVACIASTDKKDARWIADIFKHDLVAPSFMHPLDIRQLRDLMRYRFKLICFKSSEKNRFQNCITVSNIQLASIVSDTFVVSSQRIFDKILQILLLT